MKVYYSISIIYIGPAQINTFQTFDNIICSFIDVCSVVLRSLDSLVFAEEFEDLISGYLMQNFSDSEHLKTAVVPAAVVGGAEIVCPNMVSVREELAEAGVSVVDFCVVGRYVDVGLLRAFVFSSTIVSNRLALNVDNNVFLQVAAVFDDFEFVAIIPKGVPADSEWLSVGIDKLDGCSDLQRDQAGTNAFAFCEIWVDNDKIILVDRN
ncbi:hypothetical protein EQH57_0574 [Dictyocoela roeselum]|nr:hypothetical protein EQH57_0574 [Dictyocoela roeselum]